MNIETGIKIHCEIDDFIRKNRKRCKSDEWDEEEVYIHIGIKESWCIEEGKIKDFILKLLMDMETIGSETVND